MTLHVATARLGYRGNDWLDITRTGNERRIQRGSAGGHRGVGVHFAPSRSLLFPAVTARRARASWDFPAYVEAYTAEMRDSYRRFRPAWDTVLSWNEVVLLCFCTDAQECHRRVLAGIFVKLGAVDDGELG